MESMETFDTIIAMGGLEPAVPGMDLEQMIGSVGGGRVATDLKVFITRGEASCEECGEDLGRQAWIFLEKEKGALCLSCADLDHLVYLPAGDAALTRRSRKHSTLAVTAHIRHAETDYDKLLAEGWERWDARDQVSLDVERTLDQWRNPEQP